MIFDIILGHASGTEDNADVAHFYDYIRRIQHYAASRQRRRLHRFLIAMDIEDGWLDLGGEA